MVAPSGSAANRANGESAEKLARLYGLNLIGFIVKPLTKSKLEAVLCRAGREKAPGFAGFVPGT